MGAIRYTDTWGKELAKESGRHCDILSSRFPKSISVTQLRLLLISYSNLSPVEQKYFIFANIDRETNPTKLAKQLGWASRGAVCTLRKRVATKMALMWAELDEMQHQEESLIDPDESHARVPISCGGSVHEDDHADDQFENE